ncbi:MAG: hypothetical protein J2P27_08825 [Actinobacteria bacterium]|nr:hypothetical protein [Actinomycetota bacterium]
MTRADTDLAIRTALSDLTAEQPPAPHDRFQAVKQRAIRHRRRQLAGAVVTVVAALGLVAGLVQLPKLRLGPQARALPSWALPWPDHRDGSVPQSVLDRAVLAWQYLYPPNTPPDGGSGTVPAPGTSERQVTKQASRYPVVWYVGQTIDNDHQVVVMFEAAGPAGHELVVGQANASEVMHNQPAWSDSVSPWVLTRVPAPSPRRPPVAIGEYAAGQLPQNTDHFGDNWMVVLMAPDVQRLTWTAETAGGQAVGSKSTSAGLVIADTGQVTGPIHLTRMLTGHGNRLGRPMLVGIPGEARAKLASGTGPGVPQLAAPPALSEPASFSGIAGTVGQGDIQNEQVGYPPPRSGSKFVVFGICYGPKPLVIQVNSHTIGTLACDSLTHQLSEPVTFLNSRALDWFVHTSSLTAYRVDIGVLK